MSDALTDQHDPLVLGEYTPGAAAVLSDAQRWPALDPEGAGRLERWRRHPHAPHWSHATGDRVTADMLERVRAPLPTAGWLEAHLETARELLHYRRMPGLRRLEDFPPITRTHLTDDLASFVPLDADLSRMLHGSSSGSTGAALLIPDDVEEVARSFFHLAGLAREEAVDWRPDGERLALANLVFQLQAFTYVSLVSAFEQRAMARVNLRPEAWAAASDRRRFLVDADPQVLTGNPTSLAELLSPELRGAVRPLAIFSGAMALSGALRAQLETVFECPVFDVYGLHETRPIAVRTDDGPFRVLDRRVVVETLDEVGRAVPDGQIGEIVVTAGENPLLPLVRYRTGDFGRLVRLEGGGVAIADLEGRENTRFTAADGRLVPCVDLTQQLQAHGALGWSVEQSADGRVSARIAGGDADAVAAALIALLGQPVKIDRVHRVADLGEGKPRRYRSRAAQDQASVR